MYSDNLLELLDRARQVATHAQRLGVEGGVSLSRPADTHLGALLADSVLQAGLNYRTVVRPRVDRIRAMYPAAEILSGVRRVIESEGLSEFLLWEHPTKLARFVRLVGLLSDEGAEDVSALRRWLPTVGARRQMLGLHGIGPKTYDYLCCLVGLDRIPVDRHVKAFASEAGVIVGGYDEVQVVVSYAADLLGLSRRDFDAWMWQRLAH